MISFTQFRLRQFVWLVSLALSLGLIIGSYQYHYFDTSLVPRRRFTTVATYPWVFIHVFTGTIWLLSGFLQFTGVFLKDLKKHKINGYIYLVSALISSFCLIVINLMLQERSVLGVGAFPGALYSMMCVISAWFFIRRKNVELHRAWMLRSLVPAIIMPLDRFNHSLELILGLAPFEMNTLRIIAFITVELLVFRKLDFDLIPTKNHLVRIPATIFLLIISFMVFVMTMFLEFKFVNNLIYPYF